MIYDALFMRMLCSCFYQQQRQQRSGCPSLFNLLTLSLGDISVTSSSTPLTSSLSELTFSLLHIDPHSPCCNRSIEQSLKESVNGWATATIVAKRLLTTIIYYFNIWHTVYIACNDTLTIWWFSKFQTSLALTAQLCKSTTIKSWMVNLSLD